MSNKEIAKDITALVNVRVSMNWGLTTSAAKFPNAVPALRPSVDFSKPLNPYWVAGFTSGDGSFTFRMTDIEGTDRVRVQVKFNLTQHIRDRELVNYFITFFNCGSVYLNRDTASYNARPFGARVCSNS